MDANNRLVDEELIKSDPRCTEDQNLYDIIKDKQRTLNDRETVYLATQLIDILERRKTNNIYYYEILPDNIIIKSNGQIDLTGIKVESREDTSQEISSIGRVMYYAIIGSVPDNSGVSDERPFYPSSDKFHSDMLWSLIGDCIDLDNTRSIKDLNDLKSKIYSLNIESEVLQADSCLAEDIFIECDVKKEKKRRHRNTYHRKDAVIISLCILVLIGTVLFGIIQEYF